MWNIVSIVFCVVLVVVSILFLPFSVACLILLSTSGIVLVHELQWNVNLSQLQNWLKSSFEYFRNKKTPKSKSCPRVLNSNGISKPHSHLMTNKIMASPNLTPQSKFVNEPIVSDIFKMSLNDCNRHSTPISASNIGNYKYDMLNDKRNSWSNKSNEVQSMTIQKNVQTVAGPLLVSTRFNSNISSELSANASSAGFSSRVAQKGAEMATDSVATHQPKYAGIGVFPVVQLHSRSPKHTLPHARTTPASTKAVRVRIAPPDTSPLCGMDPTDCSNVAEGEESVKSVLQVLKEISRKRIHSQVDEDGDETVKRPKKDKADENLSKSLDSAVQNKRGREDSPRSAEEVKRQRRHLNGTIATATTRSNEIMSSLSSSLAVKPPHLLNVKGTKRKAHAVDWSRCSTPVSGKLLKVNTSPNQDQAAHTSRYQEEAKVQGNKDDATVVSKDATKNSGNTATNQQQQQHHNNLVGRSSSSSAAAAAAGGDTVSTPSWMSGKDCVVRIEAGQRRLLARAGLSQQHIVRVSADDDDEEEEEECERDSGEREQQKVGLNQSEDGVTSSAHLSTHVAPPTSSRLLKQMNDPGRRLKDMLAAINGGDDVSTEEATMSPNVVAILKSAKSTSSSPSNEVDASSTLSILKTSISNDAHKSVSFAKPLATFSSAISSSSEPTSLSTATVVSTSLNSYISSPEVVTTVNKVSPFTLPCASSNATSTATTASAFQNTTSKPFSTDALKTSAASSTFLSSFFSPKPEDKSQQQNTSGGFGASGFSNNTGLEETKSAINLGKQDGSPVKSLFGMPKDTSSNSTLLFGASSSTSPALNFGGSSNSTASTPVASSASSITSTQPAFGGSTAVPFGGKPVKSSTASLFEAKPAESSAVSPFGGKPSDSSTASLFGANPSSAQFSINAGNAATSTSTSSLSMLNSSQTKTNESSPGLATSKADVPHSVFSSKPVLGGSSSATSAVSTTFGGSSNATSAASSVFGSSSNATTAASSVFGGSSTASSAAPTMFRGSSNSTSVASAMFGDSSTITSAAPTMFGCSNNAASAASTMFGGSNNASSGAVSSIFGAASVSPASGSASLSTSTPTTAFNLFGTKSNSGDDKNASATTTTASSSLFGGPGSAFGSSTTIPATSSVTSFGVSSSPFGGTTSKQQGSVFGAAQTTSTFGGGSATPAFVPSDASQFTPKTNAFSSGTSAAPMFGAGAASTPSSAASFGGAITSNNVFSSGQTTSGGGFGGSGATFGGFSSPGGAFGSKTTAVSTTSAATTTQPSAFGQSTSMFAFGGQSPATSAQSSSIFNGGASTSSTLTNGGFGGFASGAIANEDKTKSGGFGGSFQPAASPSSAPAFPFGSTPSAAGGAFSFGAPTNNNANSTSAQPTENAVSAFPFSKSSTEPSKPFAFGGSTTAAAGAAANQQSAFMFNNNNNGSVANSSSVATSSTAGFQFNVGSNNPAVAAQPQVPGTFVFGGAIGSNSAFGMNPPAFTLGGSGVGGPGSPAGARFSIGSGSTSARSRSVARAKRTK